MRGSYLAQTRHSRLLSPATYGAPRNTPSLEGFLFPSTYQLVEPVKISALIADNYAVEGWPAPSREPHTLLPIHHLCLFKLGVPLGELWYLHELAAWLRGHQRSRFLLTAPPLRLPGAMGSPLTPVATV